jgi:ABC-type multidrug transport system permease subunit
MSQSKFSNSILLIGMGLIFYNTISMILNITYELIVLIVSLAWSIIKIIPNALINYPLSLICTGMILYLCKNYIKQLKNLNIPQTLLYKIVGLNE